MRSLSIDVEFIRSDFSRLPEEKYATVTFGFDTASDS